VVITVSVQTPKAAHSYHLLPVLGYFHITELNQRKHQKILKIKGDKDEKTRRVSCIAGRTYCRSCDYVLVSGEPSRFLQNAYYYYLVARRHRLGRIFYTYRDYWRCVYLGWFAELGERGMIYSHSECAEYFVKRNNLEISAIEKLIFFKKWSWKSE